MQACRYGSKEDTEVAEQNSLNGGRWLNTRIGWTKSDEKGKKKTGGETREDRRGLGRED